VRQANRADHEAREAALYAAVAKALGKTTAEVKAAFEAARPTP
jgi:UDP-N-acetylmuramyl pentapeptide synthase